MILYDYFRFSAAFRVRIALQLKGLAPERRFVHLLNGEQRSAEYKAINPQGLDLGAFTIGDQLLWGAAEPLRRMLRILLER